MSAVQSSFPLAPSVLMEIIAVQTEIVRQGQDLGRVMELTAERLVRLTGAAGAIVELAEGGDMVYQAAAGMAAGQLGLRLRSRGSLSGLCVESGRILACRDSESDTRVDREACRRVGLRSMVVAPLFHGDTAVGVLKIASPEAGFFSAGHEEILRLVSELVASSLFFAAQSAADELYRRATHDSLTGLANRALFYDRLRQGLALARRQGAGLGVMNLDMDGLKFINDTYGHRAGDAAIRELAERVSRVSRKSDTVARLGGDEFGVILPELGDADSARLHRRRVGEAVRGPFRFEDHTLDMDASIGVALFPADATEMDDLLDKADQSMYELKRSRKRPACAAAAGVQRSDAA